MRVLSEIEYQEISDFCIKEWGQGTTINYNKNFPFFGVHIPCENGGIVVDFDGRGEKVAVEWIKQETMRRVNECIHWTV